MYLVPKINTRLELNQWSNFLKNLRNFFYAREIIEVSSPVILPNKIPEENIQTFVLDNYVNNKSYYLQASPELAMKNFLANGSGDIYQICKSFRKDEQGRLHNPEFTLLEWYRVNWELNDFIQEIDSLLQSVLGSSPSDLISYHELFKQYLNLDLNLEKNLDLDYLFASELEPKLIKSQKNSKIPLIVYNFPADMAALAKLNPDQKTARRFEIFYQGIELGNGYDELTDLVELENRFKQVNKEMDCTWLNSWKNLPKCCGVAVGVDRLFMFQQGLGHILQS